jgi:hypothetical protein
VSGLEGGPNAFAADEYQPTEHALQRLSAADVRAELQSAALDQSSVGNAPACLVITIDVTRTASA